MVAVLPRSGGGNTSAMTANVRSLAPRLASTSARAAAPSRARRTGSPINAGIAIWSSRALCTWTAARLLRNVSAILKHGDFLFADPRAPVQQIEPFVNARKPCVERLIQAFQFRA